MLTAAFLRIIMAVMLCFVCDSPRAEGSPVCERHRNLARRRAGYGSLPVLVRVLGRCTVRESGCWDYDRLMPDGYASNVAWDRTKQYMCRAYRAVLLAVRPHPDAKLLDAGHLCESRACCNPDHLAWQTRSENLFMRKVPPPKPLPVICARCKAALRDRPTYSYCRSCRADWSREYRRRVKERQILRSVGATAHAV